MTYDAIAQSTGRRCFGLRTWLGSMAIETPSHRQGRELLDARHGFDRTVAGLACDIGAHMSRMIEVGVIRNAVHANPFNRFIFSNRRFDFLYFRMVRQYLCMAIHTHACGRNSCVAAPIGAEMAVLAGHLKRARVNCMRIGDGLLGRITFIGGFAARAD